MHIKFAYAALDVIRQEEPYLFKYMNSKAENIIREAVACEKQFAKDVLSEGVIGLTEHDMGKYLEFVADNRMMELGYKPIYRSKNPFDFMELQDVQEHTNFFERRVSSYQTGIKGEVSFGEEF